MASPRRFPHLSSRIQVDGQQLAYSFVSDLPERRLELVRQYRVRQIDDPGRRVVEHAQTQLVDARVGQRQVLQVVHRLEAVRFDVVDDVVVEEEVFELGHADEVVGEYVFDPVVPQD